MSEDQPCLHRAEGSRSLVRVRRRPLEEMSTCSKDERNSFAVLSRGSGSARREHTADIPGLGGLAASRAYAGEGRRWNSRAVRRARRRKTEKKPHGGAEDNNQQLENPSPSRLAFCACCPKLSSARRWQACLRNHLSLSPQRSNCRRRSIRLFPQVAIWRR